jgi:hypothetical protein
MLCVLIFTRAMTLQGDQSELSDFVKAVLNGDDAFGAEQIEMLLKDDGEDDSTIDRSVIPCYFGKEKGSAKGSLRVQKARAVATLASRAAFSAYEERRVEEKNRVLRENKGVEATQRKQHAAKLAERQRRIAALQQMKEAHTEQIVEREKYFEEDKAWVNAGDVGLPATNRFTGEPARDAVLSPHFDRHQERLADQIAENARIKTVTKEEQVMMDEYQNGAFVPLH